MNIQLGADVTGRLVAVGETPVHGARHDAHAYAASGLAEELAGLDTVADLGYLGVEGIHIAPIRKPPHADLHPSQTEFNAQLSKIRAAVEHAVARGDAQSSELAEPARSRRASADVPPIPTRSIHQSNTTTSLPGGRGLARRAYPSEMSSK
jgi:hypothetical protein